jgi:ribosomal protein S18 acetylase RimI-like enzyme
MILICLFDLSKGGHEVMGENENFIHNKYGYCYYQINSDNTALIYNLYVEKCHRKNGHAKHLIQLVKNEIGDNRETQIEADPQENSISKDDLISFYRKMGLKII